MAADSKGFVNNVKGVMNRRIFAYVEIYQQELEQVFGRC